jgi:hypothetical protein
MKELFLLTGKVLCLIHLGAQQTFYTDDSVLDRGIAMPDDTMSWVPVATRFETCLKTLLPEFSISTIVLPLLITFFLRLRFWRQFGDVEVGQWGRLKSIEKTPCLVA